MRKILRWVLVTVLVLAMSTTAFASSITDTESGNSQEVLASFEEGTQSSTVISVDISWNQMSFTYKGASEPVWDAQKHQYVGEATEAGWEVSDATITIKNHSNTILQAMISYTPETAYNAITMHFTDAAPYIGSAYTDDSVDAEGNKQGTPCSVTVKAIPDGELSSDTVANTKIGVITIKVNSDVDALAMVDEINVKISDYAAQDTSALVRGDVLFADGTDANALLLKGEDALNALVATDTADTEKNVIINALLTAFYGALDIVQ